MGLSNHYRHETRGAVSRFDDAELRPGTWALGSRALSWLVGNAYEVSDAVLLMPKQLKSVYSSAGLLIGLWGCFGATSAEAQPVVGLGTQVPAAPTVGGGGLPSPGQLAMGPNTSGSPAEPNQTTPFQWGKLQVLPHFTYQFTYGDGIQTQPGHPVNTAINAISPGLLFKIGDSLTVDYTATETLYSQRDLTDSLAHAINLGTGKGKEVGNWLLGFSQTFSVASTPMVETASQTKQENATTGVSAARVLSRKISVAFSLSQTARFAGSLGNAVEWTTKDTLNYTLSNRLGIGVYLGAGYDDVSNAPNSTTYSYGGQLNWKFSDKLAVGLDSGLESRDSQAPATGTTVTPTYSCSLNYKPFEFTVISVTGTRASTISLYQNEVEDSESWRIGLSQRLLGKLMFTAGIQHQSGSFASASAVVAASRADSGQSFNFALAATILKRGSVALTYQRSTNGSNTTGYGFSSRQIGFTLGYRY